MNQIFNSSNWRGEVEKTIKKNVRLQGIIRELKVQLDRFSTKFNLETGEPKEGKLLTKDEAATYQAFVELKLKPEDVKKMSEDYGKLKLIQDERDAEEKYADAADALGFENVPALTRWMTREKLVLEFKDQRVEEEQENGTVKKVLRRMPYVRPAADEKAAPEPLEDYIEREVPEFVDIFKTKPDSEEDGEESEESVSDGIARRASADAERRVRGKSGVRVPATRSARTDTGSSRETRKVTELEQNARLDPMYRM